MDDRTPVVIDAVAVLSGATTFYVIPPRTPIAGLLFAEVSGAASGFRFRFTEAQPWITANTGDFYEFCPPIQTGIIGDPFGSPVVTIVYSSQPDGIKIGGG